jgi:hypothetical protein
MATATPLHHPDEAAQLQDSYRFRASIANRLTGARTAESGLTDLVCSYKSNVSSSDASAMFQAELPDVDMLLIIGWYPAIRKGLFCTLTFPDGTKREFAVQDAAPGNSGLTRTLVALMTTGNSRG